VLLLCKHIPSTQNGAADALSKDNLHLFQRLMPGASAVPAELSDNLLQCLVLGTPDWTKVDCISLFGCTSQRGLPTPQTGCMLVASNNTSLSVPRQGCWRGLLGRTSCVGLSPRWPVGGLKHRTIKSYMAGIRHLHVEEGLRDPFLPTLPQLHYVLHGVKQSQGE